MAALLPDKSKPVTQRISQTSCPDRTRSLANGDFELGDEDLAAHPASDLRRVRCLEEELESLPEVVARLLYGVPLARDVEFGQSET